MLGFGVWGLDCIIVYTDNRHCFINGSVAVVRCFVCAGFVDLRGNTSLRPHI